MSYVTSTQYHKYNSIEWSFVGNNLDLATQSSFEIDIRPALTKEAVVIELLFASGVLPTGTSLTSDLHIGAERWRLAWPDKTSAAVLPNLRPTFRQYHGYGRRYELGWQSDNTKVFDRRTLVRRKQWDTGKRSTLGGRSLDDIKKLGFGPHEIVGVGFVWYGPVSAKGIYEVQTYPYSDSEDFNQAIRSFIQWGLSLNEALSMNSKQMKNLNDQALIAFALVLLSGAGGAARGGEAPLSISEQLMEISVAVTNNPNNPHTPNTASFFEALTEQFRNASIEEKVQALSKIKPADIPKLRPLH